MRDLTKLAHPFPQRYIHGNPSGGGTYVGHPVIVQRLLHVLGPYTFELVQVIRSDVAGKPPNPNGKSDRAKAGTPDLHDVVAGVVARLTVEVDGRQVSIEEAGDCEEPHNWPHDGARMKDAMSDALKRCAMRLGVGLSLWAQHKGQSEYYLGERLLEEDREAEGAVTPGGES